ncbi:enoyl-CoA hydratase/isomerase family protein [Kribbella solani]|uniref:Enoyl-CoA hydratase/carnithine racemase n=1 Tax=Kribbella solani TaxID=236067 RepID=A0A841DN20_9ACTN|nr:enoyl-CoA hydratase-related protein [Kribbella solani]MBB5979932.1 enoyl-CoA hydratase/carnithine racemase [Kribbella solani]MDX2968143.1 enoyl-CoA hydratase-related protein [Kribbella solani]MDX3004844.1 enoyl-CoA hydratase-related protein [Kribbella solani]
MADLEYTVRDGIGTILLNRPQVKNAFTLDMIESWAEALRSARLDDEVRVVVVTGAGDAFCAGIDLNAFAAEATGPLSVKRLLDDRIHRVAYAVEDLDKPLIAAVNGTAVGAGMDMALMCDIRLLARSAKLSEGYIRIGLVPGDGGCYYLPRIVGTGKALELMWTGDFVDAGEALRLRIANHVYADDEFGEAWQALARRIADQPPLNLRLIKRATYQSANTDARTALDLISSHMAVVHSTEDSAEAMDAFRNGRKPVFGGR